MSSVPHHAGAFAAGDAGTLWIACEMVRGIRGPDPWRIGSHSPDHAGVQHRLSRFSGNGVVCRTDGARTHRTRPGRGHALTRARAGSSCPGDGPGCERRDLAFRQPPRDLSFPGWRVVRVWKPRRSAAWICAYCSGGRGGHPVVWLLEQSNCASEGRPSAAVRRAAGSSGGHRFDDPCEGQANLGRRRARLRAFRR